MNNGNTNGMSTICGNCGKQEDICERHPRPGFCDCMAETEQSRAYEERERYSKRVHKLTMDIGGEAMYGFAMHSVLMANPILVEAMDALIKGTRKASRRDIKTGERV